MTRIASPLLVLLATVACSQTPAETNPVDPLDYAAQTVVVFNEAESSSAGLARYYASKRGIPKDQVVGLKCPTTEEIGRLEYDETIAKPLRETFEKKGWWKLREGEQPTNRVESTRIRFVALMRGMPLKIKPHFEAYEGDKPTGPMPLATHNEASVDAEVAILGVYTRQMSGAVNNPYFRSYQRFPETPGIGLLLVCRLDAPTPEIVRRMIDDSLAAEKTGLRGIAYIDAWGTKDPGYVVGDKWLLGAADVARRKGLPVVLDNGAGLFPVGYPMSRAAVYLGWYSEAANGPFVRPDFKFERGAVAAHIHSFSAATLRDPKKNWCGPLLAAGAAATVGNVYEPFLALTTVFDVMLDRLQGGFTFAESCYMAQPYLSWMPTFVGDPLYRPFARAADAGTEGDPKNELDAYRSGARIWYEKGPEAGAAALKASAQKLSSGLIMEGLGLLQVGANDSANAVNSFDQAISLYRSPTDVLRATLHEVFQLKALNRTPDAIAVARRQITKHANTPGVEILRAIEAEMTMATTAPSRDSRR